MDLRSALESGDWAIPLPENLLVDGDAFVADACLRLLPRKRVTFSGLWRNCEVVAKVFLPCAENEQRAECKGYKALLSAGIATPEMLWSGCLVQGLTAVVYRKLPSAVTLSGKSQDAFLVAAFELIASMHRAGIWQEDIHFENFLLSKGKMYVVDNASINVQSSALTAEQSLSNLAAFIAQFPWNKRAEILASPYLSLPLNFDKGRARQILASESQALWWARARKYLKKIFRNCTQVRVEQSDGWYLAYKRMLDGEWSEWIAGFRSEPDQVVAQSEILKDGNSATIVRTTVSGRPIVIKRYNIKDKGHGLRRLFRTTRASNSWRAAHLLAMAGIKTPEPLLLFEQRRGPLRGVSYLIAEDVGGDEMLTAYQQRDPTDSEVNELGEIFRVMNELRLCHGDLKAKNFLLTEAGVLLIDLDVFHEAGSEGQFAKCRERDMARFLRNWDLQPELKARFSALISDAGE